MEKSVKPPTFIMLIDDTPEDLFISNRILEKYAVNKRIMTFNSGLPAIEYLQMYQNEMEKIPDIIFCDLHMPVMDGYQFLAAYDKLPAAVKGKCKVFILSSSSVMDDRMKLDSNRNVVRFYEKDLTKEVVEEIINKAATD